eukprot:TRINITY_DN1147_c0_g4_i1.p1 TRINITY_DN1147_c0_g4~~TRINITY_DN1147_c0_g4_i1.p1  ORF type:complete len:212 (+),score=11.87 TRINITY_DN1147_c0_g4_i1:227-862(+)
MLLPRWSRCRLTGSADSHTKFSRTRRGRHLELVVTIVAQLGLELLLELFRTMEPIAALFVQDLAFALLHQDRQPNPVGRVGVRQALLGLLGIPVTSKMAPAHVGEVVRNHHVAFGSERLVGHALEQHFVRQQGRGDRQGACDANQLASDSATHQLQLRLVDPGAVEQQALLVQQRVGLVQLQIDVHAVVLIGFDHEAVEVEQLRVALFAEP